MIDLILPARAIDANFDVLIACAGEFSKLGSIRILKVPMNADLHMAGDLKSTGKGNLFVIFGEPDIEIIPVQDNGADGRLDGNAHDGSNFCVCTHFMA